MITWHDQYLREIDLYLHLNIHFVNIQMWANLSCKNKTLRFALFQPNYSAAYLTHFGTDIVQKPHLCKSGAYWFHTVILSFFRCSSHGTVHHSGSHHCFFLHRYVYFFLWLLHDEITTILYLWSNSSQWDEINMLCWYIKQVFLFVFYYMTFSLSFSIRTEMLPVQI